MPGYPQRKRKELNEKNERKEIRWIVNWLVIERKMKGMKMQVKDVVSLLNLCSFAPTAFRFPTNFIG
jgi:hypothetical protein